MTTRLTIPKIAEQLHVSTNTVRRWARTYRWPEIKLGRLRLFDWAEVEDHMKKLGFKFERAA